MNVVFFFFFFLQGKLTDGSVFDSSFERGDPIEFELGAGQVIPGLFAFASQQHLFYLMDKILKVMQEISKCCRMGPGSTGSLCR